MFNLDPFFNKIIELKDEFNIEVSYKRSGETNSKRIAILISDCFLKCKGDIHWAGILERKIYDEVKQLNLICDTIPCELNWEENRPKAKNKNFEPLKLALETRADRYLAYHPLILYLSNRIIETLAKERKSNGRENRKHIERRPIGKSFSRIQIHDSAMEKQGIANSTIG